MIKILLQIALQVDTKELHRVKVKINWNKKVKKYNRMMI